MLLTVRDKSTRTSAYNGKLVRTYTCPTRRCNFEWLEQPWMS